MADNDFPISSPPGDTEFRPAVPLKDAGVSFDPAGDTASGIGAATGSGTATSGDGAGVRQQLTEGASKLQGQANDKAREFAVMGKERAAGALDQLAVMLTDAAGQVDAKLGAQYGGYARNAADAVQKFSGQVKDQDFDQLLDQARELVRKSPAVAIGGAAAVGFVLARLFQSGVDTDRA